MLTWLSVLKEGVIAMELGAKVMHDVTEGGVLGGVYEIAENTGLGVELYEENIYFHPATRALLNVFPDLELLRLISSGSLLIVAKKDNEIRNKLKEAGIDSFSIGSFTKDMSRLLHRANGEVIDIAEPKSDELWSIIDKLKER
jgi:hydrogenase maturation factor